MQRQKVKSTYAARTARTDQEMLLKHYYDGCEPLASRHSERNLEHTWSDSLTQPESRQEVLGDCGA